MTTHAASRNEQRVAVGRGFRDQLDADAAAGARTIVDDEGLIPDGVVMLGTDARDVVHATAGETFTITRKGWSG
jgi:hypothetical protein